MKKLTFEDLSVGMFVKTWQAKNTIRRIVSTEIEDKPYHVTISWADAVENGTQGYEETIHWKNLYQLYVNGEWVDFED